MRVEKDARCDLGLDRSHFWIQKKSRRIPSERTQFGGLTLFARFLENNRFFEELLGRLIINVYLVAAGHFATAAFKMTFFFKVIR